MSTILRGNLLPKITDGSLDYQKSGQGNTQFLDDGLSIIGLKLNQIDPDLAYNFRLSGNWVLARLKNGVELNNTVITLLNFDTYFDKRQASENQTASEVPTTPITATSTSKGLSSTNQQATNQEIATDLKTLEIDIATKQPLDAGLTSISALTGVGYVKATGTNTYIQVTGIDQSDITNLTTDLGAKENLTNKDIDVTLSANSNVKYPSQKAVKAYVDTAVSGVTSGLTYLGTWNASTNTPTLTSGVGTASTRYTVSVSGSTNLDGITVWNAKDWAVFNGTSWEKVSNTDNVESVNGQTGVVVLDKSDVGLSNVDNTSDLAKPISTATQTSLNLKANLTALTITEGTTITTNTTLTATTNQQIIKITGNSTTVPVVVTLPVASTQKTPIMFYQDISTTTLASYLTAITAQGSDKISNISAGTNLILDAGTSLSKVYKLIPVTGGYQVLGI